MNDMLYLYKYDYKDNMNFIKITIYDVYVTIDNNSYRN